MEISVLIPTYQRPQKLAACVRALAAQRNIDTDRYEVLVGTDGPDVVSAEMAAEAWAAGGGRSGGLHITACPREGYNAVRNRLLGLARGRTLVSVNDDVLPEAGFLHAHWREQEAARVAGRVAVVVGYSPWKTFENDSLLDRLVRETSMIFFYDRMVAPGGEPVRGPAHDWGYRHCWGLNFSAPLGALREVGGFTAFPLAYGYDDIEIAHRLRERYAAPVLFAPGARAEHDHRYGAREILTREFRLGASAWRFAKLRPRFCADLFARDIASPSEVAYSREFVAREEKTAARLRRSFLELESVPAGAVAGAHAARLVGLLYEQHLLLKRWMWRAGLLGAADARGDDVVWPE